VFQVLFGWQNNEGGDLELPGLAVRPVGGAPDRVKFDVELSLGEVDGGIAGGLLYARALYDATTMERYRGYLVAMLRAMVVDARQPVARAELLGSAERTLLLETWNATEAPYPSEQCIHQLFEEQVARTPDAIAVVQGEVALTYAELNAQANRLAYRLLERGVGGGDRVATLFERGRRAGGGRAGDSQGGRRVRAAGSGSAVGTTGVDGGGLRSEGARDEQREYGARRRALGDRRGTGRLERHVKP